MTYSLVQNNNNDKKDDRSIRNPEDVLQPKEAATTFCYDSTAWTLLLYSLQRATAWKIIVVGLVGIVLLTSGSWMAFHRPFQTDRDGLASVMMTTGILLTMIVSVFFIPYWYRLGRLRHEYSQKLAKVTEQPPVITLDETNLWYDPTVVVPPLRLAHDRNESTLSRSGDVRVPLSSIREVRVVPVLTDTFLNKVVASHSCGSQRLAQFMVAPLQKYHEVVLVCDRLLTEEEEEEETLHPRPSIVRHGLNVQDPYHFQAEVQQRLPPRTTNNNESTATEEKHGHHSSLPSFLLI